MKQLQGKHVAGGGFSGDSTMKGLYVVEIPNTYLNSRGAKAIQNGNDLTANSQVYFFAYRYVYKDGTKSALNQRNNYSVTRWNSCNSEGTDTLPVFTAF